MTIWEWREVDFDECPKCGNGLKSKTDPHLEEGYFHDGDEVFCEADCGKVGTMFADETAYVCFDDEDLEAV